MVKSRKGSKGTAWEVMLPGVNKPAVVRVFPNTWLVCPPSLTSAQREAAVALVKKHMFDSEEILSS